MTTPITFPTEATRIEITDGLRQLADYLDAHPSIPVAPYGWDLLVSTHRYDDLDGIAEVDRIAAILGVPVGDGTSDGGPYTAVKAFGPITYQVFHTPARRRAAYRAHMTYANSVTPDDTDADPPQAA